MHRRFSPPNEDEEKGDRENDLESSEDMRRPQAAVARTHKVSPVVKSPSASHASEGNSPKMKPRLSLLQIPQPQLLPFESDYVNSGEGHGNGFEDGMYSAVTPVDSDDSAAVSWRRQKESSAQISPSAYSGISESPFGAPETRPSTGENVLRRLHVRDEGGGAITLAGVFVSSYCYVIMLVMAGFFLIAGAVLTAVSFDGHEVSRFNEDNATNGTSKEVRKCHNLLFIVFLRRILFGRFRV